MKLKKFIAVLVLGLLLSSQNVFAGMAPTLPNSYDGAAPTARSMAMGEAGTGLAGFNDAYYYNSAMYGFSEERIVRAEVSGVVLRRSDESPSAVAASDGTGEGFTSVVFVNNNSMALAWQALSSSKMTNTCNGGGTESKEIYLNSLTMAAGKKKKGYSVGINMTYLYGKIGESYVFGNDAYSNIASGNGFAMDFSFAIPAGKNVFFGASVKNLAGFMFWDDYNTEQLPITVRVGSGYMLKGFMLVTDLEKRFYRFGNLQEEYIRFGVEQCIGGAVCVRLGFVSDDEFKQDTFKYSGGLGLKIRNYELSAAVQQYKINDSDFRKYLISFSAFVGW